MIFQKYKNTFHNVQSFLSKHKIIFQNVKISLRIFKFTIQLLKITILNIKTFILHIKIIILHIKTIILHIKMTIQKIKSELTYKGIDLCLQLNFGQTVPSGEVLCKITVP